MTTPPPDPIHDALTAAEQAIAALWPARGVEPDVPDLGARATADRVLAVIGILEHLDPILQRAAQQTGPVDPDVASTRAASWRLDEMFHHLRSAVHAGTAAEQYLTALQHPDRPTS